MSMTPQEAADRLDPAALAREINQAMNRSVMLARAAIQRRTRVRSGTLRRSWASNVTGSGFDTRGIVASNIVYAPFQKNDPVKEGYNDAKPQIEKEFDQAGVRFGARFS